MKGSGWTNILITGLLMSIAGGQDWLDGGYVGRAYYDSDIAQYFTDPIFRPNPTGTQQAYYPYFGSEFFRDYARPYQFSPGIYSGPYGVFPWNPSPYYSDFRLRSIANLKSEPFQKNWTKTLDYAKTRSSMKVYQSGMWISP